MRPKQLALAVTISGIVVSGLASPALAADHEMSTTFGAAVGAIGTPARTAMEAPTRTVSDPSRFEFRINNLSKSTYAPYTFQSFRVMGNTPNDEFQRVLPRQGITKNLQPSAKSPYVFPDLRLSATGAVWVKVANYYDKDDPISDYLFTNLFTGGLRADGTPVLRIGKPGVGNYVDLTPGQSVTSEHDLEEEETFKTPMKVTITCNRIWQTPDGGPVISWFDVLVTPPSVR